MIGVVIAVKGEVTTRAAHSLSAHPAVDRVALLAPAKSSHFDTVEEVAGFDVVAGTESAVGVAHAGGIPVITTGTLEDGSGVSSASIEGLALALAVGVDRVETVAVAVPGEPDGEVPVVFPSPIDTRPSRRQRLDGHDLLVAAGPGYLAAAMVLGEQRHRVVVDHSLFLAGIALAAGVGIMLEGLDGPTPTWTRADTYLRTAVDMGLVIGERSGVS